MTPFLRTMTATFGLLAAGCFADPGAVSFESAESSGESAGENATDTASADTGSDATTSTEGGTASSISGASETTEGESSTSGDSTTAADDASSSSSSTGVDGSTWCDEQGSEVVLCYDFDGEFPLLGAYVQEDYASVDVTETHAVSEPAAMEVTLVPDLTEPSQGTISRTPVGVTTPFVGGAAAQVWIESECFAESSNERLAIALAFLNEAVTDNIVVLSVWVQPSQTVLYESHESNGIVGHPIALDFPLDEWVEVSFTFAADATAAELTVAGMSDSFALETFDEATLAVIADQAPNLRVGAVAGPDTPSCTAWYDDAIVFES